MDFNERVIPGLSSNFMFQEALARYEFASKYLKPGMKVLDLGCGTGYGTVIFASCNCDVVGIDINKEAIAFAKKNYSNKNISHLVGDITKLELSDKKFDVITSFEVIEHLESPMKFLSMVHKCLKQGGYFIMSTPNKNLVSPNGGVASPYHQKEFTYNELKTILANKFSKVDIFGQNKSKKAKAAWKDFLKSQKTRELVVTSDILGIRRLIPNLLREKLWKYLGNLGSRKTQENLNTRDFPITQKSVRLAYYFVAVCQKSR